MGVRPGSGVEQAPRSPWSGLHERMHGKGPPRPTPSAARFVLMRVSRSPIRAGTSKDGYLALDSNARFFHGPLPA